MSKAKRYNSLDLFKFFMGFCIIAIHTNPIFGLNVPPIVESLYYVIIRVAVPFFFLASGYLLAGKFTQPLNSDGNIAAIKKQLTKIVRMYLLWNVIYLPLAIYEYVKEDYSVIRAIASYLKLFFLVGQHYNSWMLWYLLSTIFALVFVILLIKGKLSLRSITLIGLFMTLVGLGFDYLDSLPSLPAALEILHRGFSLTFSAGRIFWGMFYIPMGMIIKEKRQPLWLNIVMFAVFGAVMCLTDDNNIRSLLIPVGSVGFFGIVERIRLKDSDAYPVLRQMSTYIYLLHMYVWFIFCMICFNEERKGLLSFICTSVITFVISFTWVKLKPKILNKSNR